jgi:competence protein ComEA
VRVRPLALVLLALGSIGAALTAAALRGEPAEPGIELTAATPEPTPAAHVIVDVHGAVASPSVFRLPAGSRVADALAAAGGFSPDADPSALNRAAPLHDGMLVYAPRRGEVPPAGAVGTASEGALDVNRATAQQLVALPGVGPATAERIVRAREKAPFRSIEELQLRGLLSARVLSEIRDLITVR